jgi:hypothetical protein
LPGLVPGIHAFVRFFLASMDGTKPAMTIVRRQMGYLQASECRVEYLSALSYSNLRKIWLRY